MARAQVFADLVRSHRQRLGLTQEELAELTGLSPRGIGKIERGGVGAPRLMTVRLLAEVFGLAGVERDRFCQTAAGQIQVEPIAPRLPAQLPPS
jgi:transcriptional regulator with XRE-family HTH domain